MFFSVEELSPRQAILPSGTLWARDAAIARTGVQRYHVAELPELADSVTTDSDGLFDVHRDAADVFDPQSMASFEGVPITLGHPIDPVSPTNWSALAVGHIANVHRDGDLLVADLLISDRRGIRAIREQGWRGISAGYDARYEGTGDGGARQRNIVANHVALLSPHEEARCGDVCRVGDAIPNREIMMNSDQQFGAAMARRFLALHRRAATRDQAARPIATTTDRMRLMRDKDAAEHGRMAVVAARVREFWSNANAGN